MFVVALLKRIPIIHNRFKIFNLCRFSCSSSFFQCAECAKVNSFPTNRYREQQLANEPYLETREKEDAFLQRVLETIERSMPTNPLNTLAALLQTVPANTTARGTSAFEDDLETELDFVNSL